MLLGISQDYSTEGERGKALRMFDGPWNLKRVRRTERRGGGG